MHVETCTHIQCSKEREQNLFLRAQNQILYSDTTAVIDTCSHQPNLLRSHKSSKLDTSTILILHFEFLKYLETFWSIFNYTET